MLIKVLPTDSYEIASPELNSYFFEEVLRHYSLNSLPLYFQTLSPTSKTYNCTNITEIRSLLSNHSNFVNISLNSKIYKHVSISDLPFVLASYFLFGTISIGSSFFNEEDGIAEFICKIKCLDRLFLIDNFCFINNGSEDRTPQLLSSLCENDSRINSRNNSAPSSYSQGFKAAMEMCKSFNSSSILLVHSDSEIDIFESYRSWIYRCFVSSSCKILPFNSHNNVLLSKRYARSYFSRIFTFFNTGFASLILFGGKHIDFNSSLKIFPNHPSLNFPISKDYTFDLRLVNYLSRVYDIFCLPPLKIINHERTSGNSSWSKNFSTIIKLSTAFLFTTITLFCLNR